MWLYFYGKIFHRNYSCRERRKINAHFITAKNIGKVQHYITLYGNFATTNKMELLFDVHVVPQSLYTKDYEEMFQEEKDQNANIEDLVDGDENNKGYYMDGDF